MDRYFSGRRGSTWDVPRFQLRPNSTEISAGISILHPRTSAAYTSRNTWSMTASVVSLSPLLSLRPTACGCALEIVHSEQDAGGKQDVCCSKLKQVCQSSFLRPLFDCWGGTRQRGRIGWFFQGRIKEFAVPTPTKVLRVYVNSSMVAFWQSVLYQRTQLFQKTVQTASTTQVHAATQ